MITKLLYLTYIPMDTAPNSGSSVRPQKMREAFETLNIDVRTFCGINNNRVIRKQTVEDVKILLQRWKPDACYIEPPSGPLFYYGDVKLIKYLHNKGVPISIFYRDAYWKYPKYVEDIYTSSFYDKIKRIIIRFMQVEQWTVFKRNINLIYFPSMMMAKEFDCDRKDALPPGCFVPNVKEKNKLSTPLKIIFVGGAAHRIGTNLMIDSFEKLNKNTIKAKLILVCPKEQWEKVGIDERKYEWLELHHVSGDEKLKAFYESADLAIHVPLRERYTDFAVPIKLFEYMSYLKPVLVSNCTETAKIVKENNIGWIVKDNVNAVSEKLMYLIEHPEEILAVRNHMKEARDNNLWVSRAQKVLKDLENISTR